MRLFSGVFLFSFLFVFTSHAVVRSDVTTTCNILNTRADVWPPESLLDNAVHISEMYSDFEENQRQHMSQRFMFISGQNDYNSDYCQMIRDFTIQDSDGNYPGCAGLHPQLCDQYKDYALAFMDYIKRRAQSDSNLGSSVVEVIKIDGLE